VIQRGEIWWAGLPAPVGSGPGYRKPVLIVQSHAFNESRLNTVIVAAITGNLDLAAAPGNVLLTAHASGLEKDSVVNISQVLTIDRRLLTEFVASVSGRTMAKVDEGLRLVLEL